MKPSFLQNELERQMEYEYNVICTIDTGKAVDSVGSLIKEVNDELSKFGVNEKMECQSEMQIGVLKCNRELSHQEIQDVKTIMQAEFLKNETFRKYDFRVSEIRCKSSQSCSQSQSR
jgi:hypothetical protein